MERKPFDEVLERARTIDIPETFDMVVAIANGGIIPAAMINQRLGCEFHLLKLNLRDCLLYTSPSPRDRQKSRMPSSA